jgi:synaptobrevin family protein YKT6
MIIYALHNGHGTVKNLTMVGYFQRTAASEIMDAAIEAAFKISSEGQFSVLEKELPNGTYCIYTYNESAVIADNEYPTNAIRIILAEIATMKVLDHEYLNRIQNPKNVDKILAINSDISDTKNIALMVLGKALERGEKIDDLVEKSQKLSQSSRIFYKTAKKQNSCCVVS